VELLSLSALSDPSVNQVLRERFMQNAIYTYASSLLIIMNPFKDVGLISEGKTTLETSVIN
jgi:myosin heavy subunit